MLDYSKMSDREIEVQLAERLFGYEVRRPSDEDGAVVIDAFDFLALAEPENPAAGWWELPHYLDGWDGAEMVAGALAKRKLEIVTEISPDLEAEVVIWDGDPNGLLCSAHADNFPRALGIAALTALDELQPRKTLADALAEAGVIEGGEDGVE